jgi:hypothetical protein
MIPDKQISLDISKSPRQEESIGILMDIFVKS